MATDTAYPPPMPPGDDPRSGDPIRSLYAAPAARLRPLLAGVWHRLRGQRRCKACGSWERREWLLIHALISHPGESPL